MLDNKPQTYSPLFKILHWIIMLLFIIQYVLIYQADALPKGDPQKMGLMLWHKSLGFTLLWLGLIFVFWRIFNSRPSFPQIMTRWEIQLAKITHFLLYVILLVMPLSGTLMTMSSGRDLFWFGLKVPAVIGKNEWLGSLSHTIHTSLEYVIMALVGLHLLGALKHFVINKDNVLQRMLFFKQSR